jgi:hypothetical protein
MTPEKLRTLSWRAFKTFIYCGVAGMILLIAVPNPGYRSAADPVVRILATSAFGLVGIAMLANLIALVSGTIAWFRGGGRCYWVLFCGMVLLVPAVIWIGAWLNI